MNIELCLSVGSFIIALAGLIISIFSFVNNRYLAVDEFFKKMEDEKFIESRNYVYKNDITDNISDSGNIHAAAIVNFYQHWGLLAKKKYLPMWVFDGGTGQGTLRLFNRTQKYIYAVRQKNNDTTYGEHFEDLVTAIKKRRK